MGIEPRILYVPRKLPVTQLHPLSSPKFFGNKKIGLTPVILATKEAEIRRISVQSSQGK
jgi:hypothetical protein